MKKSVKIMLVLLATTVAAFAIAVGLFLAAHEDEPNYPTITGPPANNSTSTTGQDGRQPPEQDPMSRVIAGRGTSFVLLPNGDLWGWGANDTWRAAFQPMTVGQNIAAVLTSRENNFVLNTDGELSYLSASGYFNAFMDNVRAIDDGMTLTKDGELYTWNFSPHSAERLWTDVVSIAARSSAGGYFITGDGELWWQSFLLPTPVMDKENVAMVAAGPDHTLIVTTDSALYARYTRFDENPAHTRLMDNVAYVSAGSWHSMVITRDGALYGWGSNTHGRVGDGGTVSPIQLHWQHEMQNPHVTDRATPVRIMENVAHVAAGDTHTLAVTQDGQIWAWGSNLNGEIGDGAFLLDRHEPVKVALQFDFTPTATTRGEAINAYYEFLTELWEIHGEVTTTDNNGRWPYYGVLHVEIIDVGDDIPLLLVTFSMPNQWAHADIYIFRYIGRIELVHHDTTWIEAATTVTFEVGEGMARYFVSVTIGDGPIARTFMRWQDGTFETILTTWHNPWGADDTGESSSYYVNDESVTQAQYDQAIAALGIVNFREITWSTRTNLREFIDTLRM
ncbi:MAG: hypothetical protein FWE06_05960 [Oscillospiraceae bacterium]|nr:hypothetical protein [Oscillospiraceae bacterium]